MAIDSSRLPTGAAGSGPLNVAELRKNAESARTETVVEANEQLVLASLHAQELAQRAVHDLDELTRVKQHDALTGTPNRALMLDRLEHAIAIARRNASHVAVLFIDLDNFKYVNDSLGHDVGDEVLRATARRLETAVRGSDTVSRHGGDEFLVLLTEIPHASDAVVIANKILDAFSRPVRAGRELIFVSASIGIAIFPDDGAEASALIHCADIAMYDSKRRGPGRYAFHGNTTSRQYGAIAADTSSRAAAYLTAIRLEERNRQETEHARMLQELREANANLIAAALRVAHEGDAPIAPTSPQLALQAGVAAKLRSSFTPPRDAVDLLNQVHTKEPLLQVLIEQQIAHLSTPVYESFDGPRVNPASCMRYEMRKTGQFQTAGDDGSHVAVLEFTVTAQGGLQDETRGVLSRKSYGLSDGERVECLSRSEFRVALTGLLLQRI